MANRRQPPPTREPKECKTLLLHKPYGYLSQFTPEPGSRWSCLADLIQVPEVYAAGRLDADSEGEEGKFYVWKMDEIEATLDDKELA